MQEKITYKEIMDLGFNEQIESDPVFYNQYGFDYTIITLNLSKLEQVNSIGPND